MVALLVFELAEWIYTVIAPELLVLLNEAKELFPVVLVEIVLFDLFLEFLEDLRDVDPCHEGVWVAFQHKLLVSALAQLHYFIVDLKKLVR